MKNRKTVVVAFLLAAVMLLGVGYAALTDTLDITGSVDVNINDLNDEFEDDIYFSAAAPVVIGGGTTVDTASVNSDNNDKASFSIKSLKAKGEKASFVFTIQNDSAHEVSVEPKLSATLGNTNTEYFTLTSDWNGASKTIAANSFITYTLTVELIKDPVEAVSGSFLVELVATAGTTTNP